jgi:hypothetical protein
VKVSELGNLDEPSSMHLMKGTRKFRDEDIQEKVCDVAVGLALVCSILSEIAVSRAELRESMSDAPHRAPTWSAKDVTTRASSSSWTRASSCCALGGARRARQGGREAA